MIKEEDGISTKHLDYAHSFNYIAKLSSMFRAVRSEFFMFIVTTVDNMLKDVLKTN